MKIAVTGLRGIPGIMGGIETHCEELLPRIAARAPDMRIAVLARAPYVQADRTSFHGVDIVPLPSPTRKSSEAIVGTLNGLRHARRRGHDIVHFHAIGPALLVPIARLMGLHTIMTHHGADYDRGKWNRFAKAMLRLGEGLGVRFAHRVICVSPSLHAMMAERYPQAADRLVYIPNGAATLPDPGRPDADILAELGLAPGGFLLAVARLVPEKGLSYLVDAHAAAPDAPPLVIAGAEMHGDDYARTLHAKAGARVIFTGALPRETLGVLYRNTALFVMPSFHEGLPIAALEAMASGAPILLSDIPANRDLGLPPQHYTPVGDTAALTAALTGPLSRYAMQGETDAAFQWDSIADATLAVYRQVASLRTGGIPSHPAPAARPRSAETR